MASLIATHPMITRCLNRLLTRFVVGKFVLQVLRDLHSLSLLCRQNSAPKMEPVFRRHQFSRIRSAFQFKSAIWMLRPGHAQEDKEQGFTSTGCSG